MQAEKIFSNAMATSPITVEDVARVVLKAMRDERPRWRYVVGQRAKLVINARRLLPEEFFDRVYFGEVMRRITKQG
jgi:hypothetical protein